jgi:hypothetical protein
VASTVDQSEQSAASSKWNGTREDLAGRALELFLWLVFLADYEFGKKGSSSFVLLEQLTGCRTVSILLWNAWIIGNHVLPNRMLLFIFKALTLGLATLLCEPQTCYTP